MPILEYITTEAKIRERLTTAKPAELELIRGFVDRASANKPYCNSPHVHYQLCVAQYESRKPQLVAGLLLQDPTSPLFKTETHGGVTAKKMRELVGLSPLVKKTVVLPGKKEPPPLVLKKKEPPPLVLKKKPEPPPLVLKKPAPKPVVVLPKKKLVLPSVRRPRVIDDCPF